MGGCAPVSSQYFPSAFSQFLLVFPDLTSEASANKWSEEIELICLSPSSLVYVLPPVSTVVTIGPLHAYEPLKRYFWPFLLYCESCIYRVMGNVGERERETGRNGKWPGPASNPSPCDKALAYVVRTLSPVRLRLHLAI